MKFEKFIKRAGTNIILLKGEGGKVFAYNDGVAMIVPENVNVAYNFSAKMPELISDIEADIVVDISNDVNDLAELDRAELPADGKAKEIRRIYKDDYKSEIAVWNTDWALIESRDLCAILTDDPAVEIGLAVYDPNTKALEGIIFDDSFNMLDAIKNENN